MFVMECTWACVVMCCSTEYYITDMH